MRSAFLAILLFSCFFAGAQRNIDVIHYKYDLSVNDRDDTLRGVAEISFRLVEAGNRVELDLALLNESGKGMIVDETVPSAYSTSANRQRIIIDLGKRYKAGDTAKVLIYYHGVPADGLIISRNKFGKRTFFADNWPNRAHNWIPCVDDPADKSAVDFIVKAPSHYQVISNGVLLEKTNLSPDVTLTHWKEDQPLPTKIMVIGIAEFAVQYGATKKGLPVSSWVYPENKEKGFYDYSQAVGVLEFYEDYIGPYPYRKLANVQSKTIFGGMENAGAIFYAEGTVTGKRAEERLIAHEIVHQWFGDHVTEKSFSHLWLSEGFATYLAQVYMEYKYGRKKLENQLEQDRKKVIAFARSQRTPVVDTVSSLMELLNANSYQKGGWILHMLREEISDEKFRELIREYYSTFAGKNADSGDFQKIAERISGRELDYFFDQWLYTPALPSLAIEWKYNEDLKKIMYTVRQTQDPVFKVKLQIEVEDSNGEKTLHELKLDQRTQEFQFPYSRTVKRIAVDPNVNLLAAFKLSEKK